MSVLVYEGFGKFSACGDFRKQFPKTAFTMAFTAKRKLSNLPPSR
jgi:hypothetical protein